MGLRSVVPALRTSGHSPTSPLTMPARDGNRRSCHPRVARDAPSTRAPLAPRRLGGGRPVGLSIHTYAWSDMQASSTLLNRLTTPIIAVVGDIPAHLPCTRLSIPHINLHSYSPTTPALPSFHQNSPHHSPCPVSSLPSAPSPRPRSPAPLPCAPWLLRRVSRRF